MTEARTHDTNGRPYAKVSEVKEGTWLECDAGFTCADGGEIVHVSLDTSPDRTHGWPGEGLYHAYPVNAHRS